MLKKCYGLFLGLVVLTGSACVTPTHASSAPITIVIIRPGSPNSATEERVAIYNNSSFEVEVTNWCLTNKSNVKFACLEPESTNQHIYLPAYSYATFLSTYSAENSQPINYSVVYDSVNSTSGSITASNDIISILDADDIVVDQFAWTSSIGATLHWARVKLSAPPDVYVDTNSSIDWSKALLLSSFPPSQVIYREVIPEVSPEEPVDPEQPVVVPAPSLPAIITELLPNAIGSDTGNEWIEVYNPNLSADISLAGYQLAVGMDLEKRITLKDYILKPGEYIVLTNAEYNYSLLNTSSKVGLYTSEGVLANEVAVYSQPVEGEAWAFVELAWQYTAIPTPGSANTLNPLSSGDGNAEVINASTVKPCAANQYRNPETNRCRLVSSSATTSPVACKQGQERNPDTNRCRAIALPSSVNNCKPGQERNPETNRCRNIKKLVETGYAVKGASTQQQGGLGWYLWAAIAGIVLLVLAYAAWEWREELKAFITKLKAKFARKVN